MDRNNTVLAGLAGIGLLSLMFLLTGALIPPLVSAPWGDGCVEYTMCLDEAGTGSPCEDALDVDDISLNAKKYAYTFYGTQSVDAYTCDIYTNDTGATVTAEDRQKINSASMTESNQVLSFEGLFDYIWVECPAITTTVTITLLACPL